MRVGILTFNEAINYGAQLQAYALQQTINGIGYECEQISEPSAERKRWTIKEILIRIVKWRKYRKYHRFMQKQLNFCSVKYKKNQVSEWNKHFDCFISGSDQVWNGYDPFYYQEMIEDEKGKIAYAASTGNGILPEKYGDRIGKDVNRFDAISVREKSSKRAFDGKCDKEIEVVVDPVFLVGKAFWDKECGKAIENGNYIFVYGTQMSDELCGIAYKLAEQTGLKICSVFPMKGAKVIDYSAGPLEFVNYVKNAEYVVTTSFHCTAFSIIYHKNLVELLHSTTGSRARDLLELVGMEQCIYERDTDYTKMKWDYSAAEIRLQEEIEKSHKFLKEALAKCEKRMGKA